MGAVWEPQNYQHVTEITLENMQKIKENSFYSDDGLNKDIVRLALKVLTGQATRVNNAEVLGLYQKINHTIRLFTQGQYESIHTAKQGALQYMEQQPADQLIAMHNHPNDQYFSVGDVGFWIKYPQITEQFIVTNSCKYQQMLKKRYVNSESNIKTLMSRYDGILANGRIGQHSDADLMLDRLFNINAVTLDYRVVTIQNY